MRKLYSGIIAVALLAVTACQSENKTNTQQDQPTEQATAQPQTELQFPNPQQAPQTTQGAATFIPTFKFYKVKSGMGFTNEDIAKNRNTAFILFDPNCSHCRDEAAHLAKHYDRLQDVNLYFVSMNDPALMATFLETFAKELAGKPNVEVLYDRNQEFIQRFHLPKQFPANYVYGPDGKLKSNWEGDKDIDFILTELTK